MNYILAVLGLVSLFLSLKKKEWTLALISAALIAAPTLLILDGVGLFYHALGLIICTGIALFLMIFLNRPNESKRTFLASILIVLPYLVVCVFKMFQLQGIPILRWSLLMTIIAFIYLTFERRKLDHLWVIYLFFVLSSVQILLF